MKNLMKHPYQKAAKSDGMVNLAVLVIKKLTIKRV